MLREAGDYLVSFTSLHDETATLVAYVVASWALNLSDFDCFS